MTFGVVQEHAKCKEIHVIHIVFFLDDYMRQSLLLLLFHFYYNNELQVYLPLPVIWILICSKKKSAEKLQKSN